MQHCPGSVGSMSVRDLKAELDALGVSYVGMTEKSELRTRLESARLASVGSAASPPSSSSSMPSSKPAPAERPAPSSSDPAVIELRRILECSATDYYGILDVPNGADAEALKKAYRKLALRLHPDKCSLQGANEGFKRISAAYSVLSDPGQRRKFDFMGPSAASGDRGSGRVGHSGVFGDQDAEELFRAFFGSGSSGMGFGAGGGSRSAGKSSSTRVDLHAGGLITRLFKAFSNNPWTLVTLLSGVASLVNIAEMLSKQGALAVIGLPLAGAAAYLCPVEHRRPVGMFILMVLFSGFFF